MSEKERKKFHSKGIFTVTQLSYTFRPRRRPKRLRDKREKYHHALKALAIREKKIHIVGSPELKIDGTPVYLDVEGLPDRDFYYLIGVRIGNGETGVQHSLWAETTEAEGRIWREFLAILQEVEKPVLIHYGRYETTFLRAMICRYGEPATGPIIQTAISQSINLLSLVFAQLYLPVYSNGLKEIAGYLDFRWSDPRPSGLKTIMWRDEWDRRTPAGLKEQLIKYNAEDCQALESVATAIIHLGTKPGTDVGHAVVHTELLPHNSMWPRFSSPFPEFEKANKAARWDYQRDRIYVRSSRRIRKIKNQQDGAGQETPIINETIVIQDKPPCPKCGYASGGSHKLTKMLLYDLRFGKNSLRKWVVEYRFPLPWCGRCRTRYGLTKELWPGANCGKNLTAYVIYQCLELYIPQLAVGRGLKRLFGFNFGTDAQVHRLKSRAAEFFTETCKRIRERIIGGNLVHVDETHANEQGKAAYVWVFATMHEVLYLYSESREGEIAHATLSDFKGVLISDFYSVYDSFSCLQQKCLLHLIRDLNAEVLHNPYDQDLKGIVSGFATVLKEVVETVDRFGLKKHFLHKHRKSVDRFYRKIVSADPQSEAAIKCKERFEKNRDKLFTFLDHDGIPWNNNNAEHAIKAFATLRKVMQGSSTRKGIEDYLILPNVQVFRTRLSRFPSFRRKGRLRIRGTLRETKANPPPSRRNDSHVERMPLTEVPKNGLERRSFFLKEVISTQSSQ